MTKSAVTPAAQCGSYDAIQPSRADRITEETKKMIEDHNNIFWCNCPNNRPPDFDLSVCKV